MVVVRPGAEERELVRERRVAGGQLAEIAQELGLRQRRRDRQPAGEAQPPRDVLEQRVDRVDADRREHLGAILGRSWACSARRRRPTASAGGRGRRPRPSGRSADAGVVQAHADQPALAVRILVDELGRLDDGLVDLVDLAGQRRDHVGHGLDGLELAVRRVGLTRGADLGRQVVRRPRRASPARTR